MPPAKPKPPKIVAHLEGIVADTKNVPDRVLGVWLLSLLTHHREALIAAELSARLVAVAAAAGVDLTAAPEEN